MSNVEQKASTAELSNDDSANGVCDNDTFENVLDDIKREINSENTAFSKVFRIADLVKQDRIWNIPVLGVSSPNNINVVHG
jgi:hypothetical protein